MNMRVFNPIDPADIDIELARYEIARLHRQIHLAQDVKHRVRFITTHPQQFELQRLRADGSWRGDAYTSDFTTMAKVLLRKQMASANVPVYDFEDYEAVLNAAVDRVVSILETTVN